MPRILVIQPDTGQASILMDALRERTDAVVEVVDSKEAAIAVINSEVPDLVLFHTLMSPEDEDFVVARLRALSGAAHLQTLTIPLFQTPPSARRRRRRLLAGFSSRKVEQGPDPCDTGQFAEQVLEYLSRARVIKETHDEEVDIAQEMALVSYSAPEANEAELASSADVESVFAEVMDGRAGREPGRQDVTLETLEPEPESWTPRMEAQEHMAESREAPPPEPAAVADVAPDFPPPPFDRDEAHVEPQRQEPGSNLPWVEALEHLAESKRTPPTEPIIDLDVARDRPPPSSGPDEVQLAPKSDRRRVRRWSRNEVPQVLGVQLSAESADLINISSTGVLLRTHVRPPLEVLGNLRSDKEGSSRLVFHVRSGTRVSSARVVRCQVASITDGKVLYDVAFRFDDSPGLELPDGLAIDDTSGKGATSDGISTAQPATVSDPTAGLAAVDAALLQIRLVLRRARRHGVAEAELRDLGRRLAPRVRELRGLRAMFLRHLDRHAGGVLPATS